MMPLLMRDIWERKGRGSKCVCTSPWLSLGLAKEVFFLARCSQSELSLPLLPLVLVPVL